MNVLLNRNENHTIVYATNYDIIVEDSIVRVTNEYGATLVTFPELNSANAKVIKIQFFDFNAVGKKIDIEDNTDEIDFRLYELDNDIYKYSSIKEKLIYNNTLKIETRKIIDEEVGDTLDQLANVDKELKLIVPVVARLYKLVLHLYETLNIELPETILPLDKKSSYDNYIDSYLSLIDTGQYQDRIDVDPNIQETVNRILVNNTRVATIVKEKYLDKKLS